MTRVIDDADPSEDKVGTFVSRLADGPRGFSVAGVPIGAQPPVDVDGSLPVTLRKLTARHHCRVCAELTGFC